MKKSTKDLRAKAERMEEDAHRLRYQADDLEADAAKLRKEADKIEKAIADANYVPALKSLWNVMQTACVTWFELACVEEAIWDPSGIEDAQRNRILILGRQFLGIHMELPGAWGGWEG